MRVTRFALKQLVPAQHFLEFPKGIHYDRHSKKYLQVDNTVVCGCACVSKRDQWLTEGHCLTDHLSRAHGGPWKEVPQMYKKKSNNGTSDDKTNTQSHVPSHPVNLALYPHPPIRRKSPCVPP